MPTSSAYLNEAVSSDHAKFTELFGRYFGRLCAVARGYLQDQAAAEDIVQDCFVKLWNRRFEKSFAEISLSYLYAMVRNRCRNHLRDQRVTSDTRSLEHQNDDSLIRGIIQSEAHTELLMTFDVLPGKCRQIFEKLFVEEKDTTQIAKEMRVSVSTVRNQKARGLSLIRQSLKLS